MTSEFAHLCGRTVQLSVPNEGIYRGEIVALDVTTKTIRIKSAQIVDYEDGGKYIRKRMAVEGELSFCLEKADAKLIDDDRAMGDETMELLPILYKPAHQKHLTEVSDKELLAFGRNKDSFDYEYLTQLLPHTVVDSEEQLTNAIRQMKNCSSIAIAAEGTKICRGGKLCWFVVAAKDWAYLIDALAFKEDILKTNLKEVLESNSIEKIVHDCRFISDLLYHNYGIALENVWECQAFQLALFDRRSANKANYYSTLPALIQRYLEIPAARFPQMFYRASFLEADHKFWTDRPFPDHLRNYLSAQVSYLPLLHKAMLNRCLEGFHEITAFNLKTLRDSDDDEHVEAVSRDRLRTPSEVTRMVEKWPCDDGITNTTPVRFSRDVPQWNRDFKRPHAGGDTRTKL